MVKRMVCPKCGMQGKPNDRFCGKCGILLVEKEVEDTNQSTENMNSRANAKARLNENDIKQMFSKFLYFITNRTIQIFNMPLFSLLSNFSWDRELKSTFWAYKI